jgi:hypothetical protein
MVHAKTIKLLGSTEIFQSVLQNEMQTSMLIACQQMNGQVKEIRNKILFDYMEHNIIFDKNTNRGARASGTVAAIETTAAGMFAIFARSTPT